MKTFRADLHIHSVLSPCGDLDMSPRRIVEKALDEKLDAIAITDHNSTRQCGVVMELGAEKGLWVIPGVEVNTREEVHCVSLFENVAMANLFQEYLDNHLPNIPNNPLLFGHQVWVNRDEEILGEEQRLLWGALNQSIEQVASKVASLDGLFFPAHINRPVNGIIRQLGFIPPGLKIDAVEVCSCSSMIDSVLSKSGKSCSMIANSDAHSIEQIGRKFTLLTMEALVYSELRKALNRQEGRYATPIFNNPGNQLGCKQIQIT